MPYPSEHSARLTDPEKYKRFARQNDKGGPGIDFVFGITADGKTELQAIRFDTSKFTAAEAKKWLKKHRREPIRFEAATGEKEGGEKAADRMELEAELNVRGLQFEDVAFRSYSVGPASWKDEDRGFDAVLATEQPVVVKDMKTGRIVQEILRMDGASLPTSGRIPLQDAHSRRSVRHTLGSTRDLRVENGQLVGRNIISSAEPEIATKIKEGHITDNSLGYFVLDREMVEPGAEREIGGMRYRAEKLPIQVTRRWRPKENSLTPIGADEAATFRSSIWGIPKEEKAMAEEQKKLATLAAEAPADETPEGATEAPAETPAELSRRDALAEITPRGWDALLEEAVIKGLDLVQYRALLLAELGKRQKPLGTPEPGRPAARGIEQMNDEEFRRVF